VKKILFVIAAVWLVAACNKNESDTVPACSGGTMEVLFEDTVYAPVSFNNSLFFETGNGQPRRRLDIRTTVKGNTVILSVYNWDWQNPPQDGVLAKIYSTLTTNTSGNDCATIDSMLYCEFAEVTFLDSANGSHVYVSMKESYAGFVEITEFDNVTKRFSGTFDAKLTSFLGTEPDTVSISGTFTDLCYLVPE